MTDASGVGLGFGQVWHPKTMTLPMAEGSEGESKEAQEALQAVIDRYCELEKTKGRQGMPRLGQDITKTYRPGLLGDSSEALVPEKFREKLSKALKDHHFEHGSGLNRWRLTGTYPKQSWQHGLPAAGAHSGGTSDIFLALN